MFDDVDFSPMSDEDLLLLLRILRDQQKDPSLLYELREKVIEGMDL
ncbi:hypothetical protein [Thioalkalivibrio sp. ALE16]|nr:hypothetical protein [Thioalkalivibrio sp. ALE16]